MTLTCTQLMAVVHFQDLACVFKGDLTIRYRGGAQRSVMSNSLTLSREQAPEFKLPVDAPGTAQSVHSFCSEHMHFKKSSSGHTLDTHDTWD